MAHETFHCMSEQNATDEMTVTVDPEIYGQEKKAKFYSFEGETRVNAIETWFSDFNHGDEFVQFWRNPVYRICKSILSESTESQIVTVEFDSFDLDENEYIDFTVENEHEQA